MKIDERAQGWAMDPALELAMKIDVPFTVATVGDMIQLRPIGQLADDAVQTLLDQLRSADVAMGNLEGGIADGAVYRGSAWGTMADHRVADDLRGMGFDLLTRANNLMTRNKLAPTDTALERVGLAYAGVGGNLQEARAPRLIDTPKGRVGLVGMVTVGFNPPTLADCATYQVGSVEGQPGTNPLRVGRAHVVSAEQIALLRQARASIFETSVKPSAPVALLPDEPLDRLDLFGTAYVVGETPGAFVYTMHPDDLLANLRAIRNGKQVADFLAVTVHTHEGHSALQARSDGSMHGVADYPSEQAPQFLIDLAHAAIDAGADLFFAHGVHVLRGIEIYAGKPIFYGLSNFIFQTSLFERPDLLSQKFDFPWVVRGAGEPAPPPAIGPTPAEENRDYADYILQPKHMCALLAESRFEQGLLRQIRLVPVDLGAGEAISRMGVPRRPAPGRAREILDQVRLLSERFGTRIRIDQDIGIIDIA